MAKIDEFRAGLKKDANRTLLAGLDLYKDPKIRGLYKSVDKTPGVLRQKHRGGEPAEVRDLEGVARELIRNAPRGGQSQNYEQRCWIVCIYLAVGRGGEPKFLRYDEMAWDEFFQALDATWIEIKTLTQHCSLFGPDSDSYLCDFYHCFFAFFAAEDGLYRRVDQERIARFVFPSLHSIANATVTNKITGILRKYVAEDRKASTSAKSLRQSSNTELAAHPQISFTEQNERGGWSSGTNGSSYTESNPALSYPGMLATSDQQFRPLLVYDLIGLSS